MDARGYIKFKTYYLVRVSGIEQYWSRSDPKKLEDPKPFEGYISSIDWAYQASKERDFAYKFDNLPPPIQPEWVGPWWYKIDKVEIIKVRREIKETEEIVS